MMDQEKPFKTIEVIDNDTKQVCKIACMSCIRGHRTTSCGIPVCRTKIFWTVKRPGRPSNSCTCRFHSSGVCKCVTTIPKCPHKSKKGEKRTSECRCDEQGRFCCLLEPEHWRCLMQLQKPNVQFYPSREALEGWPVTHSPTPNPDPPATTFHTMTPQRTGSCCSSTTQGTSVGLSNAAKSPQSSISIPRFSLMDISASMDLRQTPPADAMIWNEGGPISSVQFHPIESIQPDEVVQGSCCQGRSQRYSHVPTQPYEPNFSEAYAPYSGESMPLQPTFDFDRWTQDYQIYQFPNAICQNCGLNGCTCRSCPPLMQNFQNTSWAQSCGRRHARIAPMPPTPSSHQLPQTRMIPHTQLLHTIPMERSQHAHLQDTEVSHQHHSQSPLLEPLSIHTLQQSLPAYDGHLMSTSTPDALAYSDFLMHELDRPSHVPDEHMFNG